MLQYHNQKLRRYLGGMVGEAFDNVTLEGISIGGTFDISNAGIIFGGVVGRVDNSPVARFLRNTATITGLQPSQVAGGVIGQAIDTSCITLLCAMVGYWRQSRGQFGIQFCRGNEWYSLSCRR